MKLNCTITTCIDIENIIKIFQIFAIFQKYQTNITMNLVNIDVRMI